jgi:hypothetical protein
VNHPKNTPDEAWRCETRLMELLEDQSLSLKELERSLARDLSGHSAARRGALIRASLAILKKRGSLYEYPRLGAMGVKYSRKPAESGPYLKAVKKAFDALAVKLQPAGITREKMIEELRNTAPAPALPAAANVEQSILDKLKGRPGGLSIRELRGTIQGPGSSKDVFDRAVLELYESSRVYLDRHDRPAILSDAERQELVSDGAGNYFIGITLRGGGAQPVS